jgi:hypothetical protein
MPTALPQTSSLDKSLRFLVRRPDFAELRESLIHLWSRNLPDASPQRLEWLYRDGGAQGWILRDVHESLIGAAGLLPRQFSLGGDIVDAGAAIDLNVDRGNRIVGPALSLARAVVSTAEAEGRAFLYGMPISSAAAVLQRVGYAAVGEMTSWTLLLRSEFKLRQKLRSGMLAKLAAPLVDATMRLTSPARCHRLPPSVAVESCRTFDDRFDRLWNRAVRRFDIIGVRSTSFLNWRFARCHDVEYQAFALIKQRDRELLGYLVWYRDENSFVISDLLTTDENSTTWLLAEFTRHAHAAGVDAIRFSCLASNSFYRQLADAGFSRRAGARPVLVRPSAHLPMSSDHSWYMTTADRDTDL